MHSPVNDVRQWFIDSIRYRIALSTTACNTSAKDKNSVQCCHLQGSRVCEQACGLAALRGAEERTFASVSEREMMMMA